MSLRWALLVAVYLGFGLFGAWYLMDTTAVGADRSAKLGNPPRSANRMLTSTVAPPSSACDGSARRASATSGDR